MEYCAFYELDQTAKFYACCLTRCSNLFSMLRIRSHGSSKSTHKEPQVLPIGEPPPDVPALMAWREPRKASTKGDDPLAALYRMYEYFVVDDEASLRNGIRYFFGRHDWPVCDIPDAQDPDPQRYAILAAITGLLVLSFNRKIAMGLPRDTPHVIRGHEHYLQLNARPKIWEKEPKWSKRVKSLKKRLVLPSGDGDLPPNDKHACRPLLNKNIFAWEPNIYFV